MSSTANAASVGQIRSGLRALGESLRRGRRKVCPVLGLIEIETASKLLFSLSVQNVSVCAKSNVGTLVSVEHNKMRGRGNPINNDCPVRTWAASNAWATRLLRRHGPVKPKAPVPC